MLPFQVRLEPRSYLRQFQWPLLLFRCLGLFPVSRNPRWSLFLANYSCVLILIEVLMFVRLLFLTRYGSNFVEGPMSVYITFVIFGMTNFTSIFIMTQMFRSRHRHATLYELFEEIDSLFENQAQVSVNLRQEIRRLLVRILVHSGVVTGFLIAYLMAYIVTKPGQEIAFYALIGGVANRMFCMLYVIYMYLVDSRLELILKALEFCSTAQPATVVKIVLGVGSYQPMWRDRIDSLRIIYSKLWLVTDTLERIFGLCLLTIVLLLCVVITCNLYWLILGLMGFGREATLGFWENVCLIAPNVYLMVLMTSVGERCVYKRKHIINALHNASLTEASKSIRAFQEQVCHQVIEFSAHGFFSLRSSFIGSVTAAIVTYLIILLQFHGKEIDENENSKS